jgi:hypothetical protein
MKGGDLGRRCWMRTLPLGSMVAPLGPRPPCVDNGGMGFSGCVWVACFGYMGGKDGCFCGGEVLALDRLGRAFGWKLLHGSSFGWHFVGVLSSSRARWMPMLRFVYRGLANTKKRKCKSESCKLKREDNRTRGREHKNLGALQSPRARCSCVSIYSGRSIALLQ